MSLASLLVASAVMLAAPAIPPDTARDSTIVYVFPTSPQTFVPVKGLPSFLAMPGAPLPIVATQVVYTATGPLPSATASAELSCADFVGPVRISEPDRFHLDKDGDGIGCEAADR